MTTAGNSPPTADVPEPGARLRQLADHHGAAYRLIPHAPEGRTREASVLRGHDLAQGAKCLVVAARPTKRTCRYVLAVVPGDRRVDLDRIAGLTGCRRAGFADRDTAERLAGSVSGSIIPFSFHPDLELIVDEDLLRHDTLYFNAARLDLSMALPTADYLRMVRPRTARISAPPAGSPVGAAPSTTELP
ncbi:prolyl-tRNA synthetase [Streptomyces sp. CB00316]|uniref:YbaK/EbsC family protein n=1 Tax=unclassified Streptomyces TaxID=2593676 RepID=UPI000966FBE9|nr:MULTISPECIES: YbaK/EbsC family protein [unclassified Streptomyces]MBT2377964.1 YbaK/prolyl-tRNA synthetase associated domain-containing protein [Streptomyces sp. ISL-111]MBT2428878.1 YbaK/prolyl-tRNA synthetase associated domain-containing protein [Streptomyces sp. ISL-112]MBT2461294.1 YbaK/prolyl-tRNA synthetase associated domain-containing protein [Streptomyces sp. ISL-63]OKJ19564.1 prolyl-tRNA synthetase [Streptomyces sp. CB00316]